MGEKRTVGAPECRICGSSDVRHLQKNDGGLDEWDCNCCGYAFVWPIPTQEYLSRFYNCADPMVEQAKCSMVPQPNPSHKMLISIVTETAPKMKILDVGAGFGNLINHYKQRGHDVYAYEYSELCANFLRSKSIRCFEGLFGQELFTGVAPFDAVFMSETLEHVDDPERYLRSIYSMLSNGGRLYISVPNKDFLLRKSYLASFSNNPHLSHFTENSLRILLGKVGFKDPEFFLAPYDTYSGKNLFNNAAIHAANLASVAIRALLSRTNLGFQLYLRVQKPLV